GKVFQRELILRCRDRAGVRGATVAATAIAAASARCREQSKGGDDQTSRSTHDTLPLGAASVVPGREPRQGIFPTQKNKARRRAPCFVEARSHAVAAGAAMRRRAAG